MPDTSSDEHAVVRLVTAYHDSWQAYFPGLFKRSHWHTASHLCTRGRRRGVPFAELHGVGGKVFWLNDETMKARVEELARSGLCTLDPSDAPITKQTMVAPTQALLEQFDAHLIDFAHKTLPLVQGLTTARGVCEQGPLPCLTVLDDTQRQIVLRALECFREPWKNAIDHILDMTSLSTARLVKAKRNLMSTPHAMLLHTVVDRHFAQDPPVEGKPMIEVNEIAVAVYNRIKRAPTTVQADAKELVELGFLDRLPGMPFRVVLGATATPLLKDALVQAAMDLPDVARKLLATLPPATSAKRPGEQTSKIVRLAPPKPAAPPDPLPEDQARHVSRERS